MHPTLSVAFAFLCFAFIHSLTVSRAFKRRVAGIMGETWMRAYYRLAFTVLSVFSAGLAGYVIFTRPDVFIFMPPWYLQIAGRLLQAAGVIIFIYAQMPFDLGSFTGVRQARDYILNGKTGGDIEGIPGGALVTDGAYGLVRHPMYLAGILVFLFEPAVTLNNLALRALAAGYFVFGSIVEERRFALDYGEPYLVYRKKVPRLNILAGVIRKYL